MVKILGILCSPHKNGNSSIMLTEALAAAKERGADVETVWLFRKKINPCDSCRSCIDTGKCHIDDDMTDLYEQISKADALVFATPVYYLGMPGHAKSFLDRLFAMGMHNKLRNKVGATLICASSIGQETTWNQFNHFFALNHMPRTDHVFGFGRVAGDVKKDRHAMLSTRELSKQVVALVEKNFQFPEEWHSPIYRYITAEYNVSTSPSRGRCDEPQQ